MNLLANAQLFAAVGKSPAKIGFCLNCKIDITVSSAPIYSEELMDNPTLQKRKVIREPNEM